MKVAHALIAGAVLLAGCSGEADDEGGNNSSAAAAGAATEQVDPALYEDQQNKAVPISPPSPQALQALPASFTGRWALTANDCDPARADNKGLMTVEPGKLSFYESRGTVARATRASPERIDVRVAMSGEGQSWTSDQTLTLLDDGRTLVRDTASPQQSLRYQRCPA